MSNDQSIQVSHSSCMVKSSILWPQAMDDFPWSEVISKTGDFFHDLLSRSRLQHSFYAFSSGISINFWKASNFKHDFWYLKSWVKGAATWAKKEGRKGRGTRKRKYRSEHRRMEWGWKFKFCHKNSSSGQFSVTNQLVPHELGLPPRIVDISNDNFSNRHLKMRQLLNDFIFPNIWPLTAGEIQIDADI